MFGVIEGQLFIIFIFFISNVYVFGIENIISDTDATICFADYSGISFSDETVLMIVSMPAI